MATPMGVFRVDCEIVNPRQPRRSARVRHLLVDTGSEFTWVPGDVLDRTGIRVVKKDQQFVMANGQTVTRSVGYAIIRAAGFETIDEVVFAQPGDLSLLGSRTLEGFGAHVDGRGKRLVAAGPHLAASPVRR
jgi:predicted aspartyl protease